MFWHNLKKSVAENLIRLPNGMNMALASFNRNPDRVFGKAYSDYKKKLAEHYNAYDAASLLLDCVNKAVKEVPYYNRLYGGKVIDSITAFESEIGFIDKDVVLGYFDDFLHPGIDFQDYDSGTTGGTSGKPMRLIVPKSRFGVELATMHSMWARAGYHFDIRAVIRNHRLPANTDYMINPVTREVIFDGFRMTDAYYDTIYRIIVKYRIAFIHCYPSHARQFALFLLNRKADVSFLKAFLSGSENILEETVDLIQNRLGIRFYNWYGHSEKLVLGGYCEKTDDYHIEPVYGYFELIDEENRVIRTPGRFGEIVGTGYHNPGMVFLRYRTGDFAEYVGDACPACGRRVPIIRNIRGRWSGHRLYNIDGSFVTTTALNLHSDVQVFIHGLQYVQKKMGEVSVLVVKSPDYREEHEQRLMRHFRERFAPSTALKIQYVDRLLIHPNGKFVQVISEINDPLMPVTRYS